MEVTAGFGGQGRPLTDAEAVLLVGDDEAQASKLHAFAEKCVGADHEVDFSGGQGGGGLALLGGGHGTDEQGNAQTGLSQERFQGGLVLVSQKLGGGHEGSLTAVLVGEEGAGRKLGFIAQEMGREINTMGSKANESNIQILVVKMKDELEKIKEQVLNIL